MAKPSSKEVERRLGDEAAELRPSDEYVVYEAAIRDTFGEPVPTERSPGQPRVVPERRVPEKWSNPDFSQVD